MLTDFVCLHCGAAARRDHLKYDLKYCSLECHAASRVKAGYDAWLRGDPTKTNPRSLRRYVIKRDGYMCAKCGLGVWQGEPLTLELEHKDGNSENQSPANLCMLCPNCHSQSPTYRSRNKGNGRHARRQRYAEGKSH